MFHGAHSHFVGPTLLVMSWLSTHNALIALIPSASATLYYLIGAYVTWRRRNK